MKVFVVGETGLLDGLALWSMATATDVLMYVERDAIPDPVRDEIERLAPSQIVVVGGTLRVSTDVEAALGVYAPTHRVWGPRWYNTPVAISRTVHPPEVPPVEPPVEPPVGGYPDETTTGPSDETLVPVQVGPSISSTHDGQVIENFHTPYVTVKHRNVIVQNGRISNPDPANWWAMRVMNGQQGQRAIIRDLEIRTVDGLGNPTPGAGKGIDGAHFDASRLDIHHIEDGVMGNNFTVEDSYIHDLVKFGGGHMDGIAGQGYNYVVRGNRIDMQMQTGATNISPWSADTGNILIERNLLTGGSYTVYCRNDNGYKYDNIVVRDNEIVPGEFGYLSKSGVGSGWVWENNRHALTGEVLSG